MFIKFKYIDHSGVFIEGSHTDLLIDYYRGQIPRFTKDTYVISTHSHEDHYNPKILDLKGDITYIFSSDIKELEPKSDKDIHYLDPDDRLEFEDLSIRALGSTDQGTSVLINLEGTSIFHAGDLNLWIWPEDKSFERRQMSKDFIKEIEKLSGTSIDLCFFPVDSRLKSRAADGAKFLLDNVDIKAFVPIHTSGDNTFAVEIDKLYPDIKFFIANEKEQEYELIL